MSALVHCDGPSCKATRQDDEMRIRVQPITWLRLKVAPNTFAMDFCSKQCLIEWAKPTTARPTPRIAAIDRGTHIVQDGEG